MNIAIPTVGVVVLRDTEVLLVKHLEDADHATGLYGLPAGRIDPGEGSVDAAFRELYEETGLRALNLIELPTTYKAILEQKSGNKLYAMTTFLCTSFEGDLANSEETKPLWVSVDELLNLQTVKNVPEAINEALLYFS